MSAATLDARRKRLRYRAGHRATKEADLLLGRFADCWLASLTEPQVDAFEALLEEQDLDILNWIMGREPAPAHHQTEILTLLRSIELKP